MNFLVRYSLNQLHFRAYDRFFKVVSQNLNYTTFCEVTKIKTCVLLTVTELMSKEIPFEGEHHVWNKQKSPWSLWKSKESWTTLHMHTVNSIKCIRNENSGQTVSAIGNKLSVCLVFKDVYVFEKRRFLSEIEIEVVGSLLVDVKILTTRPGFARAKQFSLAVPSQHIFIRQLQQQSLSFS